MAQQLKTIELSPAPGVAIVADVMEGRAPAYVFLHGMSSFRAGEKSEALCERARQRGRGFACFDFRGHGQSSGEMTELTMTDLIQDGTTVLLHMGPSILIGSSLGGLVAAWVAARNHDLVRGLALLSPAFGYLPEMAREEAAEFTMQNSGGDEVVFNRRTIDDARQYEEGSLPGRLPMPVLLVHGKKDDAVPYGLSVQFFDAIPHDHKKLWLIPDGDHRLNLSIEEIYDRMEAFME